MQIAITIETRTPVMNPPTLDGLLARVRFDETNSIEEAHTNLPLQQTSNGLWYASSAIIENRQNVKPVSLIASLRPSDIKDMDEIQKNDKEKTTVWWSHSRKRDCGNVRNQYEAFMADSIWYFCTTTDVEELKKMLAKVTHVGKLANKGFGEITDVRYQPAQVNGIHDQASNPLRPIPVTQAQDFGINTQSVRADMAWRPAYWNPINRTECFIMATPSWDIDTIEETFL